GGERVGGVRVYHAYEQVSLAALVPDHLTVHHSDSADRCATARHRHRRCVENGSKPVPLLTLVHRRRELLPVSLPTLQNLRAADGVRGCDLRYADQRVINGADRYLERSRRRADDVVRADTPPGTALGVPRGLERRVCVLDGDVAECRAGDVRQPHVAVLHAAAVAARSTETRPHLQRPALVGLTLLNAEPDRVASVELDGVPGDQADDVGVDLAPVHRNVEPLERVGGTLVDAELTVRVLLDVLVAVLQLGGQRYLDEALRYDERAAGDWNAAGVELCDAHPLSADHAEAPGGHVLRPYDPTCRRLTSESMS